MQYYLHGICCSENTLTGIKAERWSNLFKKFHEKSSLRY